MQSEYYRIERRDCFTSVLYRILWKIFGCAGADTAHNANKGREMRETKSYRAIDIR